MGEYLHWPLIATRYPPEAIEALMGLPGYQQARVLYTLYLLLAAEVAEARGA